MLISLNINEAKEIIKQHFESKGLHKFRILKDFPIKVRGKEDACFPDNIELEVSLYMVDSNRTDI